MHDSVNRKLFLRELNGNAGCSSIQSLYGSRAWVNNLDIVNELHGHTGCVNAISWSRNGALLASGSDDTQINIHTTTPEFALNTRIDTGHTENIFSVKFMPHSGDRTLISAAGDSEVRIFDIEYAPTSSPISSSSSAAGPPRLHSGIRALLGTHRRGMGASDVIPQKLYSYHSNPPKVYRSHTDRAKRIVTESSPHVFLTCSEDGTVRQFDLRQPSSFYARPSGRSSSQRSYFGVTLTSLDSLEEEDNSNPPLISYRRHRIDLNTVSCSTSQPHYIALGGAHPHCFLHDRRMLGRDLGREHGGGASSSESALSAATRCVRRFASRPAKDGDYRGNPHITACKISDANPNDVVVSWSGGGIYLFDINRSPEPNEKGLGREPWDPAERNARARRDRGRRHAGGEPRSKRRRAESSGDSETETILPGSDMMKIAGLVVNLRKEIFGMNSSNIPTGSDTVLGPEELDKEKKNSWDAGLGIAHVLSKRINRDIRNLDAKDMDFLNENDDVNSMEFRRDRSIRRTLARNRRRTRTFVKAAGCLARALGGSVKATGLGADFFLNVGMDSTFRYRFLHIIITFIDGGPEAVEELIRDDQEDMQDEGDEVLETGDLEGFFRTLENEASNNTVRDVDTNEEIFGSEKGMVKAFKGAIELERDHVMTGVPNAEEETANRSITRFWGERVGRALLMKEGEGIDFTLVDSAFGDVAEDDDDDDDEDDDDDGYPQTSQKPENDESEEEGEHEEYGFGRSKEDIESHASIWEHTKAYSGHCNVKTVKDINFYGMDDEYVVSGSDCGHLFIWDKKTTQIVNILHGDDEIVNVVTGHPYEPKLAVSGIDYTVKIFSPDEVAQRQFQGLSVDCGSEEDTQTGKRVNGSRKRMQDSYTITSQNEAMTESGLQEAVHTRAMLSLLAGRLRDRRARAGEHTGDIHINAEQECNVSRVPVAPTVLYPRTPFFADEIEFLWA